LSEEKAVVATGLFLGVRRWPCLVVVREPL
jgi:hypothetical protein